MAQGFQTSNRILRHFEFIAVVRANIEYEYGYIFACALKRERFIREGIERRSTRSRAWSNDVDVLYLLLAFV